MGYKVSNATTTIDYTLTNAVPAKPYLIVVTSGKTSYLPCTTASLNGYKCKFQVGTYTCRAQVYSKTTYYTTAAAVGNMSSTTALTRSSISTTLPVTAIVTTNYSYPTRASTSTTLPVTGVVTTNYSYPTRASTSGTASNYVLDSISGYTMTMDYYKHISATYATRNNTYIYNFGCIRGFQAGARSTLPIVSYLGNINVNNVRTNNFQFTHTRSVNAAWDINTYSVVNGAIQFGSNYTSVITAHTFVSKISNYITSAPIINGVNNGYIHKATSLNGKLLPFMVNGTYQYATSTTGATSRKVGRFIGASTSSSGTVAFSTARTAIFTASTYLILNVTYLETLTLSTSPLTRPSTSTTIPLTKTSIITYSYPTRASTSTTIPLTKTSITTYKYPTRSSISGYSGVSSSMKWV